jgi:isocitrate dehydrogenase kinase/phosphatase
VRRPPSTSRLGHDAARVVLRAFSDHRVAWLAVTGQAQTSFEQRDWTRLQRDGSRRLLLYSAGVQRALDAVGPVLGERADDRVVWLGAKAAYSALVAERPDWDLAETFFNSVGRRVLGTVGVDDLIEFVDTDFEEPPAPPVSDPHRAVQWRGTSRDLVERILDLHGFAVPWLDRAGDAARVAERIDAALADRVPLAVGAAVLRDVFFRGKAAYVVGRLATDGGPLPLVLALRNGPRGLFVDAVLTEEADLSILFSFTRSYFHVPTKRPWDVVAFLSTLLPQKRRGELYISLGHPKQGKTELFRNVRDKLDFGPSCFETAPGTPGLVMVCFGLSDQDLVMKVIRDHFPAEKSTSPELVAERYTWVHLHDRAGRLVDAQSFTHLRLPRDRFEPTLLRELLDECSERVWEDRDFIVIERTWVERRMEPLNLYMRRVDDDAAKAAIDEYAAALRDLAACDIFPGDLLLKNFGVTRHGRVAFYDYDELVALTDCHFRDVPEAQTYEQEMAAEPWYSVSPADVFPEEFPRFLGLPRPRRAYLMSEHGELFTAAWWRSMQAQVAEGKVVEFVPYREGLRFGDPSAR